MKYTIEYSTDRVFKNEGRNNQGQFLDTVSMPGNIKIATIEAKDVPTARKLFWDEYSGDKTIRSIYEKK